eukprot:746719-Hanusia_phi.AAC.1
MSLCCDILKPSSPRLLQPAPLPPFSSAPPHRPSLRPRAGSLSQAGKDTAMGSGVGERETRGGGEREREGEGGKEMEGRRGREGEGGKERERWKEVVEKRGSKTGRGKEELVQKDKVEGKRRRIWNKEEEERREEGRGSSERDGVTSM